MKAALPYVVELTSVGLGDVALVGGKNASLGELLRDLKSTGIRVPDGFAVTVPAYREFIEANGLDTVIETSLRDLDVSDVRKLSEVARDLRKRILEARLPEDLELEIARAYEKLCKTTGCLAGVAVRSSATAEDLPEASFAGQQETYLNVQGSLQLLDACKKCFASLFTDRAIVYRSHLGLDPSSVGLSIGVQTMVRSDLACAGVIFTIDTETGFENTVLITGAYGLGETVVQGQVNPDEYVVFKPTLKRGFRPILQKRIGSKELKMIYESGGEKQTRVIPVPKEDRSKAVLTDDEVLELARWAIEIEEHYGRKYDRAVPMDIEWAKDGVTGELFVVQARPETVQSRKPKSTFDVYRVKGKGSVLAEGRSVGSQVRTGPARVIRDVSDLDSLAPGEILVTEKTNPDWEPVLKRAAAVVTDQGGRTCHAAIVSRELGIPAVVGAERATNAIETGRLISVSCAEGETGYVYEGKVEYEVEKLDVTTLTARPRTKIMMNLADPTTALALSRIPNDGVGLAREEFIITKYVQVHPLALTRFDQLDDRSVKRRIEELTAGYANKSLYFVDKLSEGIALIAAAFHPRDVILRFSDFKTNEYAKLLGGSQFEPPEENPMIGFRGASRYYDEKYRDGFALECAAVSRVRKDMGLTNLKVMVPFCRTVAEAEKVVEEMKKNGLEKGVDGLEIYVMCEIPSNVLLLDEFAEIFDGFSIGSNDLTQLVLGVDRDSGLLAHLFDERNDAVKKMIAMAIRSAKKKGRKIGICGQAPSDFPDFAEFLVREGINSISLNPDVIVPMTLSITEVENRLSRPATMVAGKEPPRSPGPHN